MGGIESQLFLAARIGGCSWMVGRGADVNACDRWDLTPLYYASLAGNVEAARTLLEAGAIFDESTYHAALNRGMRKLLRSYGRPRPPQLAPFPAALLSAFHACPANRAGADAVPCPAPPDITLYVQGRPIEAHRVMLAARSPYFRKKLTTEWRNRCSR